jgi:phosphohistidine swiveling domain-containing protein
MSTLDPVSDPRTKAETLACLQGRVSQCAVLPLAWFSLRNWREDRDGQLRRVLAALPPGPLAVRSSAWNEDGEAASQAGRYRTLLDVPAEPGPLAEAVERVLASFDGNPLDQVLVQPMLQDVSMCGVITSHDLTSGAPYITINYDDESGRTDVVTGGRAGINKTVVIHRGAPPRAVRSPRIARLLAMLQELEDLWGGRDPLDVEFALTREGGLYLLQLRRIAVRRNWNRAVQHRIAEAVEHLDLFLAAHGRPRPGLAGSSTILGQMPDWNPAELIGAQPAPLAVSLFRFLVSDHIWRDARAAMGYRPMAAEPLLVQLAGRPYVDVRNSFNSFLPPGLPADLEHCLVDAWLGRLAEHPELHDKVEFEVADTALDFAFEAHARDRYPGLLAAEALGTFRDALRTLTAACLTLAPAGTLQQALATVERLRALQGAPRDLVAPLRGALSLLRQGRDLGSLPFCVAARHAFIAEALLRTAVERGALRPERLAAFRSGLATVASDLARDFARVLGGTLDRSSFMARYGHLRPGTFDLLSPRYDQREDLFRNAGAATRERDAEGEPHARSEGEPFTLVADERTGLARLLAEAGLPAGPDELASYAITAIRAREWAKFVFTRNLSDAMEGIADWGETTGLTREDLVYLTLEDLRGVLYAPDACDAEARFHDLAEARRAEQRNLRGLRLGHLIRSGDDLHVVPIQRGSANYVTTASITARAVFLDSRSSEAQDLYRKIVCIESADPGFDWIFARGLAGLVTKFGGANSHMTIRCAELGIPAVIGVGEAVFEHLARSGSIELRCGEKTVRPVHA